MAHHDIENVVSLFKRVLKSEHRNGDGDEWPSVWVICHDGEKWIFSFLLLFCVEFSESVARVHVDLWQVFASHSLFCFISSEITMFFYLVGAFCHLSNEVHTTQYTQYTSRTDIVTRMKLWKAREHKIEMTEANFWWQFKMHTHTYLPSVCDFSSTKIYLSLKMCLCCPHTIRCMSLCLPSVAI